MNWDQDKAELISAIKNGSEKAFKILFDTFHMKIYTVARRIGVSHDDAEDIVQETFIQFWKQKDSINEELGVNGLLYIIAKRLVFKKIEQNEPSVDIGACDMSSLSTDSTNERLAYNEINDSVNAAIELLPEGQKIVFSLSYQRGLSVKEIAEKLKLSTRTVENQIFRSRKQLKSILSLQGILPALLLIYAFWHEY